VWVQAPPPASVAHVACEKRPFGDCPGLPHLWPMTEPRPRSALPRLAGEFIVIVLGVLVALGVDEWRGNRADARQEVEYYRSLVEDLDRDIAEYEFARDFIAVSIRAAEHVLSAITGAPATDPFPTLVQAVQYASWVNYPAWSSGTLDELVSSGTIRLMRDQVIKRAMLLYYDGIAEWKPRLQGPEFAAFIEYRSVTAGWVSVGPAMWTSRRSSPPSEELASLDPQLERRLRGNERMLGLTQQLIWQWKGFASFMQKFDDEAVALRSRIEEDLEGR